MTVQVLSQAFNDAYILSGEGCNYIEFVNQGDTIVTVNRMLIYPNGSWAPYIPLAGDADYTQYDISFENAAGRRNLIVNRKFYK